MRIYDRPIIEFVNDRQKYPGQLDPATFENIGPTEDEIKWHPYPADGPERDIFVLGKWLNEHNVADWWWKDRAPDRMVHRYTLFFKNERDRTMFALVWP